MRPDSRTDHTDDDRESPQPAAYPVFTGDRDPADIPLQRHGENPFGTPPGGYAAPPEPVDEFDRGHDSTDDEPDRTEYPATEHTADERAEQAPDAGADDGGEHTRHTFADADARTDRSDHGGADPDEVAVGRASVPGDTPTLDPDEREAVASTAPTAEDYHRANAVATDPVDRDDPDVRPTVLHGTERETGFHDGAEDEGGRGDALPDLDRSVGHNVAAADDDRPTGYHDNTTGLHDNTAEDDGPQTGAPADLDTSVGHSATATDTDRPTGYHDSAADDDRPSTVDSDADSGATGHPDDHDDTTATHHDEEEPVILPAPVDDKAHDTADDDGHDEPTADELKPGDAEVAPVPTFWAATDTDGYRDRWREAQLRFVDDPQGAADEIRGLVGEAAEAVARALAEQRRDLDAWSGEGDGPRDTEQLRVVIQRYRTFFDRLLKL
ncbi:hypothetical protein Val02_33150 [Virgisporangium aliadipatigenens]|uniref:Uncharacterized protein n=1 Tax=Virgisporangium aliadipatigenens TaxID=741659 RepID=A0A8J3YJF9_9ACTN|nr:hypothetical protein [Virgisporangium aliadipatigenens]GIJ46429.1 hypothetical protein Val02_33150 [Virgisporangium aliadipatigenens]